jgi:hypothetical protein
MTILFAGISALIGMLIHNRLPTLTLHAAHQAGYTDDQFGVRVVCEPSRTATIEEMLRSYGPSEVRVER